jgi:uncharacterized membrane protein
MPEDDARKTRLSVAHPDAYCWLVFVGALDVICTWIVLHFGGAEVNPLAQRLIGIGGHWGLIALKFTMIALVIVICEHIAPRRPRASRRLAYAAVAISSVPVALGIAQLAMHVALS